MWLTAWATRAGNRGVFGGEVRHVEGLEGTEGRLSIQIERSRKNASAGRNFFETRLVSRVRNAPAKRRAGRGPSPRDTLRRMRVVGTQRGHEIGGVRLR